MTKTKALIMIERSYRSWGSKCILFVAETDEILCSPDWGTPIVSDRFVDLDAVNTAVREWKNLQIDVTRQLGYFELR